MRCALLHVVHGPASLSRLGFLVFVGWFTTFNELTRGPKHSIHGQGCDDAPPGGERAQAAPGEAGEARAPPPQPPRAAATGGGSESNDDDGDGGAPGGTQRAAAIAADGSDLVTPMGDPLEPAAAAAASPAQVGP